MIAKEDARHQVLAQWQAWLIATGTKNPNGIDGLMFFTHLQSQQPSVLEFRDRGDNWQTVHAWLLRANLVSD